MGKSDKGRSKQVPLLYISQPNFKVPAASMQKSFVVKTNLRGSEAMQQPEGKVQLELEGESHLITNEEPIAAVQSAATEAVLEEVDATEEAVFKLDGPKIQEKENEAESALGTDDREEIVLEDDTEVEGGFAENEEVPASGVRKSFRDMTIEEKLMYVLHRPHYIPKVLCEVQTKNGMYIGYITSFTDGVVVLRTQAQFFTMKIAYTDIVDIQMRAL